MRIFFLSLCVSVLLVVRCDDAPAAASAAADKASDKAADASAAAKATADAAKDTSGAAKEAAGASEKAADAAKDASSAAADASEGAGKASEAAADAAESAKETSGAAKEATEAVEKVTSEEHKCVFHRPKNFYPKFKYKFEKKEPSKEELAEERKIMKHKNPAIHAALVAVKELRKQFHEEREAHKKLKDAGKEVAEKHFRYVSTKDGVHFKHSDADCYLLKGFRHLHIKHVVCKAGGDDGKCKGGNDAEIKVNTPSEYNSYDLYCHETGSKTAKKFEIKVAKACACQTFPCLKGKE